MRLETGLAGKVRGDIDMMIHETRLRGGERRRVGQGQPYCVDAV
jgi:hypothetical protein